MNLRQKAIEIVMMDQAATGSSQHIFDLDDQGKIIGGPITIRSGDEMAYEVKTTRTGRSGKAIIHSRVFVIREFLGLGPLNKAVYNG